MNWRKLGLIYTPQPQPPLALSHACLPVPLRLHGDVYRVFHAVRDDQQRAHIWFVDLRLREPFDIVRVSDGPVFSPGPMGTHDEHGVYPSSIVQNEGRYYLYTSCWNRGERSPLNYNSIGLALSDDGETFQRYSPAPILQRSEYDPCFVAMPMVRREAGGWRMWYSSGYRWEQNNGALKAYYNIRCADSSNGLIWKPTGTLAIDHADSRETSIARAWVIRDECGYRAWYGYTRGGGLYRIGYATSVDGNTWQRQDQRAGIETSETGWDSEMMAHPAVVQHDGRWFMFYNGNGFARDGIGLAVADALD